MIKALTAHALSIALILLPIAYFLAPTATASFFPSYLIGLLGLWLIGAELSTLRRVRLTSFLLLALFFTLLTSNHLAGHGLDVTARYFGYALLILTYIFGFYVCASRVSWFLQTFMITTVIAAAISSFVSISLYFSLDYQPLDEPRLYALGRLNNPTISAISYGSILCLVLSFSAETRETGLRALSGIVALCLITAIILAESRGAWLALAASVVVILALHKWKSKKQFLAVVATFTVALLTLSFFLYQQGHTDVFLRRSFSFRPEIWEATLNAWLNVSVIFGAGIATKIDLTIPPNRFMHPHSIYLSTLYYGGILGLLCFIALLGRLLWLIKSRTDRNLAVYATPLLMFGLVVLIFDGNKLIEKVDFLWLCLWLPIALLLVAEARFRQSTPQ